MPCPPSHPTLAPHPTLLPKPLPQDYIYLHRDHTDWVTKVEWIPEIGLTTSSLDATIKVCPGQHLV
jgi:hypothetical protein